MAFRSIRLSSFLVGLCCMPHAPTPCSWSTVFFGLRSTYFDSSFQHRSEWICPCWILSYFSQTTSKASRGEASGHPSSLDLDFQISPDHNAFLNQFRYQLAPCSRKATWKALCIFVSLWRWLACLFQAFGTFFASSRWARGFGTVSKTIYSGSHWYLACGHFFFWITRCGSFWLNWL